jgi:hypothetical protein
MVIIMIILFFIGYITALLLLALYSAKEDSKIPKKNIFSNKQEIAEIKEDEVNLYMNKKDLEESKEFFIYDIIGQKKYKVEVLKEEIIIKQDNKKIVKIEKDRGGVDNSKVFNCENSCLGTIKCKNKMFNRVRKLKFIDKNNDMIIEGVGKSSTLTSRHTKELQVEFSIFYKGIQIGNLNEVKVNNKFESDFYNLNIKTNFNTINRNLELFCLRDFNNMNFGEKEEDSDMEKIKEEEINILIGIALVLNLGYEN